ncbi:MAG: 16S rRNA (uracil(1498)-N(3))-methyltransferase [Alphaproteobacteria bacterium]|nr:16S rRNA (uracil(1498)-N(3))-methyltransferase [Alphaproteobacteria bacterium]
MRQAPRLYVDAPLAAGGEVALSPEQAHYLRHVLRQSQGDSLHLFNGRDGEWLARAGGGGRAASARVASQLRPQAGEGDLWLAAAPLKRTPYDLVAQKATELGVARLIPVMTERTQSTRVKTDRLRAITIEAAEQCERLTVPKVTDPFTLARLIADWPRDRALLMGDETGGGRPLAEVAATLEGRAIGILIGPEGGFAPAELDALAAEAFVTRIDLGPRIMKAETAALAALAVVQAIAGDWRAEAPRPT